MGYWRDRSIGLPDHQQKVTFFVMSLMLALRWVEENISKYWESKAPIVKAIHAVDYSRRLDLFEGETRVESYTIFRVVQGDVDLVAVCLDKESHEEASEGVSSALGRDRAGSLQETIAHPSQWIN